MKQKESKIRALIAEGEYSLAEGPHPERARRDAETLLLQVFNEKAKDGNNAWLNHFAKGQNINSAWLIANQNLSTFSNFRERFKTIVNRRLAGEPIQYILGETEFYGLPFRVTPDVLIPRPETEHLVEKVIELAAGAKAPTSDEVFTARLKSCPDTEQCLSSAFKAGAVGDWITDDTADTDHRLSSAFIDPRIVDIGTGSGAIAVALAQKLPNAKLTAIDLSDQALKIARENAERNGVSVRFLQGDLLTPVAGERFEIIVSNPPYVAEADRATLSVEVREFEPALALFAGDGLEVYRRLIPVAFSALVPGGFLALEIGFDQSPAITELLSRSGFEQIEFVPDLQGIPRVACARRPQKSFSIVETTPSA